MDTECQQMDAPLMCENKCGFFGNSSTLNLCSKCYKDVVLNEARAKAVAAAVEQPVAPVEEKKKESEAESEEGGGGAEGAGGSSGGEKQAPNRCFTCKKRVGLTGFKCRCGNMLCALHRYSDKHECSFDFKALGRDVIAKANPVVKADKIDKI